MGARKYILALAAIAAIAVLALYARSYFQGRRLEALWGRAAGVDTVAAQEAVRELAAYTDPRSTSMLLEIAEGRVPAPWPDVQAEAVRALAERRDARIADALAELLQPHVSITVRGAVARALGRLPCESECVAAVLHYLERISQGEPNTEDRARLDFGHSQAGERARERTTRAITKQQEAVYIGLYDVLRREDQLTTDRLVRVYGLGTAEPSKFALALIVRMHLTQACPALLRSREEGVHTSPEVSLLPREEIKATVASLGCR